jgi:hypothetical protein
MRNVVSLFRGPFCVSIATMRVTGLVLCSLLAAACGSVEGPLLRYTDGADASPTNGDAGSDAGDSARSLIAQNTTWQYQLTGPLDLDVDAGLFVLDLFDLQASQITQLHARGSVVVAYLSAGTRESYRSDAGDFPASAVGNTHPDYPNEAWLDVRDSGVRAVMAERLALAQSKGFDGVLPTNLSAYLQDSGFDLTAADQRAYDEWLAREAHARGLEVGLTDFALAPQLVANFDWAIHFECLARGECDQLEPFAARAKPVLDVEFEGEAAQVCARAAAQGLNVLIKHPQFDAYRVGCL